MTWIFDIVKAAVDAAQELHQIWTDQGKDVKEMRAQSFKVYVAFEGEDGTVINTQRDVEALLPDGD